MEREEKLYTTSADYVYDELLHRILTRQIRPGERLAEVDVAVSMGVSRTPVREALRRLASQGLLEIAPNIGARLVSPTRKDVEDAFMVRSTLESMAVKLAIENINATDLDELEGAIKREERALQKGDLEEYLEVNEDFHRIIAQLSGNRVLEDFIKNCIARISIYTVFCKSSIDEVARISLAEHKKIFDSIKEKDTVRAERAMKEHIINTLNSLLSCVEKTI